MTLLLSVHPIKKPSSREKLPRLGFESDMTAHARVSNLWIPTQRRNQGRTVGGAISALAPLPALEKVRYLDVKDVFFSLHIVHFVNYRAQIFRASGTTILNITFC